MARDTAGVATAYGVNAAPWSFVIDINGWIQKDYKGLTDSATLISFIETLAPCPTENKPPVASFVWSPDPAIVNQVVTFDASASSDPDGTIVSYAWAFGDGGTGTGVGPTHTYTVAGDYTVTLTVTDDDGLTGATTKIVTVNPPPEVKVCVDIKPGSCPNPINVKSRGVFAVAIKGSEDFDVETVDPATVKLYIEGIAQGVSPIRWSYQDVAMADGYLDIVFHFDTQTVVTKLGLTGHLGETLPLIIKGNLYPAAGGLPIQGQDYIWVLKS